MSTPSNAPTPPASPELIAEAACPRCDVLAPAAAERCPGCQFLLRPPEILPFLRRPGARLSLLAGLLGILGVVSYGLSAAVGVVLAAWALAALRSEENRRLAPGVRLLAVGALTISLSGLALGGWGLYGRYLQPHWRGIHDWERRQTVLNTFRVLTAAEMRYSRRHPHKGFSARLDQLSANPWRLGISPELLLGAYTLRRFGYDYRYHPTFGWSRRATRRGSQRRVSGAAPRAARALGRGRRAGDPASPATRKRDALPTAGLGPAPIISYRIFAHPTAPGAGPCYVCGPDGLPRRLPCRPSPHRLR